MYKVRIKQSRLKQSVHTLLTCELRWA